MAARFERPWARPLSYDGKSNRLPAASRALDRAPQGRLGIVRGSSASGGPAESFPAGVTALCQRADSCGSLSVLVFLDGLSPPRLYGYYGRGMRLCDPVRVCALDGRCHGSAPPAAGSGSRPLENIQLAWSPPAGRGSSRGLREGFRGHKTATRQTPARGLRGQPVSMRRGTTFGAAFYTPDIARIRATPAASPAPVRTGDRYMCAIGSEGEAHLRRLISATTISPRERHGTSRAFDRRPSTCFRPDAFVTIFNQTPDYPLGLSRRHAVVEACFPKPRRDRDRATTGQRRPPGRNSRSAIPFSRGRYFRRRRAVHFVGVVGTRSGGCDYDPICGTAPRGSEGRYFRGAAAPTSFRSVSVG